jgi:hypothetical protein
MGKGGDGDFDFAESEKIVAEFCSDKLMGIFAKIEKSAVISQTTGLSEII